MRNLLVGRRPVYALGEWAASFAPALLALSGDEVELFNDDRVGRSLSRPAPRRPARRAGDPDEVWHTTPAPWPSSEGHRIIWVRSGCP